MAAKEAGKRVRREAALLAPYVNAGEAALDVICGSGLVARQLMWLSDCSMWVADVTPHLRCNLPYAAMKAPDATGFASLSFDVALLRGVLHHLPPASQEALLLDALRVSRRVLLLEPLPGVRARLADRLENLLRLHAKPLPGSYRDGEAWQALASQAGRVDLLRELPGRGLAPTRVLLQVTGLAQGV